MPRTIVLARQFDSTLDELATIDKESNGVLLYRRQDDYLPIENIFMTGIGSEGHVQAEQERMNIVNEFFRRHPDYNFVKFHTHTAGTIRKHGDYYATHFSEGDIRSYEAQLRDNPDFIGMVVTPKTKLLYAPDNPNIKIVQNFPSKADSRINAELKQIAATMGYDLRRFEASKRK